MNNSIDNLILAVRNIETAQKSVEDYIKDSSLLKKINYFKCDISEMKSVRKFSQDVKEKFSKINLLINNGKLKFE